MGGERFQNFLHFSSSANDPDRILDFHSLLRKNQFQIHPFVFQIAMRIQIEYDEASIHFQFARFSIFSIQFQFQDRKIPTQLR